ncbi:MAG: hypothetical protein HQK49_15960 [Oligoflexia bacterium]|nr:hypothetical protein [Oligoflexia bacterium]
MKSNCNTKLSKKKLLNLIRKLYFLCITSAIFILIFNQIIRADDCTNVGPKSDISQQRKCIESFATTLLAPIKTYTWGNKKFHDPMSREIENSKKMERIKQIMANTSGRAGPGLYLAFGPRSSSQHFNDSLLVVEIEKGAKYLDLKDPKIIQKIKKLGIDVNTVGSKIKPRVITRYDTDWLVAQTHENISFQELDVARDIACADFDPLMNIKALSYIISKAKKEYIEKCKNFYSWDSSGKSCKHFTLTFPKSSLVPITRDIESAEIERCPVKYRWEYSTEGKIVCNVYPTYFDPKTQTESVAIEKRSNFSKLRTADKNEIANCPVLDKNKSSTIECSEAIGGEVSPQSSKLGEEVLSASVVVISGKLPSSVVSPKTSLKDLQNSPNFNYSANTEDLIKQLLSKNMSFEIKHPLPNPKNIKSVKISLDKKYFDMEMGGAKPNNTLKGHTIKVYKELNNQLKNKATMLANITLPKDVTNIAELMKQIMMFHDIGKPQAVTEKMKETLQHSYTVALLDPIFNQLGRNSAELALAKALINNDTLGDFFQKKIKKNEAQKQIEDSANSCGMSANDFLNLQLIFYCSDAGVYNFKGLKEECNGDKAGERFSSLYKKYKK